MINLNLEMENPVCELTDSKVSVFVKGVHFWARPRGPKSDIQLIKCEIGDERRVLGDNDEQHHSIKRIEGGAEDFDELVTQWTDQISETTSRRTLRNRFLGRVAAVLGVVAALGIVTAIVFYGFLPIVRSIYFL